MPVTGRRRFARRLLAAARSREFTGLALVCTVLTLFLYPGAAASAAEPNETAIDAIVACCAGVLALETICRQASLSGDKGGPRRGGLVRPLFEAFMFVNLALDVSTLAAPWAERQTGGRILVAIRAARVSRVLRLWFLVQTWRQRTVRLSSTEHAFTESGFVSSHRAPHAPSGAGPPERQPEGALRVAADARAQGPEPRDAAGWRDGRYSVRHCLAVPHWETRPRPGATRAPPQPVAGAASASCGKRLTRPPLARPPLPTAGHAGPVVPGSHRPAPQTGPWLGR